MLFEDFASANQTMLWATFAIAFIMGAVVNKTNFCTMGAVSDLVNMGESGRMRAWVMAATVAMLGVVVLEATGMANLSTSTLPPYRGGDFQWGRYLLGGFLFGIGMTLASGCGNKTLIRIGGGNIKSIFVFAVIAVIAYFMVDPYKQLEATWYQTLFSPWLGKASITLDTQQDLGAIVGNLLGVSDYAKTRYIIGAVLGVLVLLYLFKSAEFRKNFDNVLAGLVVGGAVIAAWYVTSNIRIDMGDGPQSLTQIYQGWDFLMDSAEGKPQNGSTNLLPQSFTFISPIGQAYGYATAGFKGTFMTFGVMSVLGVILGSLLWSLVSKGFRIEWFASFKDFVVHMIGAVLMGFGGVLGLGCTVGQGITGVSTLALGSFLVFASIVFGSALTMKMQYYKLLYEEEATLFKSFITALVDFKMLPAGMRKLEAM